ncbi:MAG: cytochrome c3 family protein [Planctomycetota bacterium]
MQTRTRLALMFALVVLLVGTSSVFAQVQITDCMSCHNDTTVITDKQTGMSEAVHGTGESYGRGTSAGCAGCHSGGAFSKMVAAGLTPDTVEAGDPNPTRQDCRTCHQVHTSYTVADWALETTAPVKLYAFEDKTYDGGKGNLCANCHQPRRLIAAPDADGNINVSSSHWGPHHGPQSAMLLGQGGAGDVIGNPSAHAMLVRDTCVTCHIGKDNSHTFEAVMSSCLDCHQDAEDFDIDGVQTEVEALIAQVRDLLVAKGLLDEEGHPIVGIYPAAQASALWNYIFIVIEDGSLGVHNPLYTKALLEASIAALQ